jgi:hypothetical protein
MQIIRSIQNRIYEIRGEKILLDFDLAALYEVETRVLNQAVKRNSKRFPGDFMFQLTWEEWEGLRSQIETLDNSDPPGSQIVILNSSISKTLKNKPSMRSQIVTASQKKRNINALPYAFTEQGVAMLSGILNSDKALNMNIAIMRAFVEIRRILLQQGDIKEQLRQIQERINDHDIQLSSVYEVPIAIGRRT